MADPASSSAPDPNAIKALAGPILTGFATATQPIFVLLLESTFFTALLVPIVVSLLYFSTPRARKSLIWNLVLFTLCIGLGAGAYSMHIMSQPFVHPLNTDAVSNSTSLVGLWSCVPWLIDAILLVRLITVYPYVPGHLGSFVAIMTLPIVVKIARVIVTTLFLLDYSKGAGMVNPVTMGTAATLAGADPKLPKIEWALQMVDNGYASALFLWKLRLGFRSQDSGRLTIGGTSSGSFASRIRELFWIAVSNFVIPVLFNIVLLAIPYPSFAAIYVQLANLYVSLIGVVFATVWSGVHSQTSEAQPLSYDDKPYIAPFLVALRSSETALWRRPSGFSHERKASEGELEPPLAVHVRTSIDRYSGV